MVSEVTTIIAPTTNFYSYQHEPLSKHLESLLHPPASLLVVIKKPFLLTNHFTKYVVSLKGAPMEKHIKMVANRQRVPPGTLLMSTTLLPSKNKMTTTSILQELCHHYASLVDNVLSQCNTRIKLWYYYV